MSRTESAEIKKIVETEVQQHQVRAKTRGVIAAFYCSLQQINNDGGLISRFPSSLTIEKGGHFFQELVRILQSDQKFVPAANVQRC